MSNLPPPENLSEKLQRLAGYLNFSSGVCDTATLTAWNDVYCAAVMGDPLTGPAAWLVVRDWLAETIDHLKLEHAAFEDCQQASRVIQLLWSELLPAYLDFHRDLLFHQVPELIFNGFFMARAAEVLLADDLSADDDQVIQNAINALDDFVGYRPVAMLENRQCQPYRHEFVRPIPLYVKGAGISSGPYHDLIETAIETLKDTDPSILGAASFDPDRLEELAMDPRAYDFDHPVNRRPNYHFGGWDDRSITDEGYYNRFVVRQVTMEALLSRLRDDQDLDPYEVLQEAASVLAGTILMASAINGWGPGWHSSDITLGSLMKPIAAFRDAYYEDRLKRLAGSHRDRLNEEQRLRRQPFGAARQHLNAALAERRAAQLQHVQLARLYARMGYPDAAKRQTDEVAAASARMTCRIDCLMTLGLRAIRTGNLSKGAEVPTIAFDLLQRGIECGAMLDPWDILGFGGNFSLYPGPESAVHDSRVDHMITLTESLFEYTAHVWSEAAAQDQPIIYQAMDQKYREMAQWWREYAAHTISSIEAADPLESYESAKLVARALKLWHEGGAEAGNVGFWAPHAELFDSPRAYALVISALLERKDFVPAMALLVHWLGQADRIGLRLGESSLPKLSEQWLLKLRSHWNRQRFSEQASETTIVATNQNDSGREPRDSATADTPDSSPDSTPTDQSVKSIWTQVRRLFDYFEANAEEFWTAPLFQLGDQPAKPSNRDWERELHEADESDDLYSAAYEDVTYNDTTDDGNDGAIFEFGDDTGQDALEAESKRLTEHLSFMQSLAKMWAVAADIAVSDHDASTLNDRRESLEAWSKRAKENRIGLLELLASVREHLVAPAGSDKDSMRSYDRRRVLRDSLMERIIGTAVEMSDARRLIDGAILSLTDDPDAWLSDAELAEDDLHAIRLFGAIIACKPDEIHALFPQFIDALHDKSLLYIPLARGGDPVKIYLARLRQRVLRHLMQWLPRRGLIAETCRLIETAREMEQSNPIGIGAVTEFDSLFRSGHRSLVAALVESARASHSNSGTKPDQNAIAEVLIPQLERLTETMLASWLAHSQTLRLSPLEMVSHPQKWQQLVEFIKKYGDPIFTQMFLQLGNVRAILHQGVGPWLQRAMVDGDDHLTQTRLFEDLENGVITVQEAERWMTLVYESLIDHHTEYLDYNSTTTQSDRGDLVYMFLDFLRLRVRYERIAWNLKPVMWAHEVLVRSGLQESSAVWRRSLSERISSEADIYVKRLKDLQSNYAMRMPTVADRIQERFVQPMTIDRMRALVGPAMQDAESNSPSTAFELLEQESEILTQHPTGVGLDVPAWIDALEEEVESLVNNRTNRQLDPHSLMTIKIVPLSQSELDEQLELAQKQGRRLPHVE
ncbi:hypothetical protein N9M41_03205 [Rhodopirellula sp.]|nr:hypothetical protein [Rhodopirellula sp.]